MIGHSISISRCWHLVGETVKKPRALRRSFSHQTIEETKTMSTFMTLDTGYLVASDDPKRGIWYSVSCGYWTDDWDNLRNVREKGIPCCPVCKMVGMQTTADDWFSGMVKFEKEGNEGYDQFCREHKEKCDNKKTWMQRYQDWFRVMGTKE